MSAYKFEVPKPDMCDIQQLTANTPQPPDQIHQVAEQPWQFPPDFSHPTSSFVPSVRNGGEGQNQKLVIIGQWINNDDNLYLQARC